MEQTSPASPSAIEPVIDMPHDDQVIRMWLFGKSAHTQRNYKRVVGRFLTFTGKTLATLTLADVQAFSASLTAYSTSTQAASLAAIKSLLSFAHRLGYTSFDVGKPVRLPKVRNRLAERFLTESEVHSLIALESNPRNRLILQTLYYAGLRVSEVTSLTWRDLTVNGDSGQITVHGKGDKTRAILLPTSLYRQLDSVRGDGDDPVFLSRSGGHLSGMQVHRIVQSAAKRAGIERPVSPHWLRHCHASHSIDRGCPLHVLSATLGHSSVAVTSIYLHAKPSDSSGRYLAAT